MTIQDNLTKYSEAIPLRNTESTAIAMALAEQFISRFGCPRAIQTDQGSNFISEVMATFCRIFKIRQLKSTTFHPQSLGSLERSHHVLIQYLKQYCEKTNWDNWIYLLWILFISLYFPIILRSMKELVLPLNN